MSLGHRGEGDGRVNGVRPDVVRPEFFGHRSSYLEIIFFDRNRRFREQGSNTFAAKFDLNFGGKKLKFMTLAPWVCNIKLGY